MQIKITIPCIDYENMFSVAERIHETLLEKGETVQCVSPRNREYEIVISVSPSRIQTFIDELINEGFIVEDDEIAHRSEGY